MIFLNLFNANYNTTMNMSFWNIKHLSNNNAF